MDPRSAKTDEDLLYQYKTAWAFAQASEQILSFIEQMTSEAEGLTAKEQGKTVNKLAESMS